MAIDSSGSGSVYKQPPTEGKPGSWKTAKSSKARSPGAPVIGKASGNAAQRVAQKRSEISKATETATPQTPRKAKQEKGKSLSKSAQTADVKFKTDVFHQEVKKQAGDPYDPDEIFNPQDAWANKKHLDDISTGKLTNDPERAFNLGNKWELRAKPNTISNSMDFAMSWYEQAAKLGHARAAFRMGEELEKGVVVEKNIQAAFENYKIAADKGDRNAQRKVALILDPHKRQFGEVHKNDKEAFHYYQLAARQGDPGSQYELAHMYLLGRGTKRNFSEARKYFESASQLNHPLARNWINTIRAGEHVALANVASTEELLKLDLNSSDLYKIGVVFEGNAENQEEWDDLDEAKNQRDKAIQFYEKAAELGHKDAIDALETLKKRG